MVIQTLTQIYIPQICAAPHYRNPNLAQFNIIKRKMSVLLIVARMEVAQK